MPGEGSEPGSGRGYEWKKHHAVFLFSPLDSTDPSKSPCPDGALALIAPLKRHEARVVSPHSDRGLPHTPSMTLPASVLHSVLQH